MRAAFSRDFYIPKNSIPIHEEGLGTIYVSTFVSRADGKPRYHAVAFTEKAIKPSWNYSFKTDKQLDEHVEQFFTNLRAHKQRVKDRRAVDYGGHNFKVRDIVTNSWGYDQTNVDWYIVKRTSTNYVWLRPVAAMSVEDDDAKPTFLSGHESLKLDENLKPIESGEVTQHRATGNNVTMRHGCGSKWTGEKKYTSWGH